MYGHCGKSARSLLLFPIFCFAKISNFYCWTHHFFLVVGKRKCRIFACDHVLSIRQKRLKIMISFSEIFCASWENGGKSKMDKVVKAEANVKNYNLFVKN
jgi:hypothetical protein